ncbi:putative transporter [Cardiobacteriaceae bacterium TAE3-ERU3]|nr:putative transporter [Cardiobacteriaceae bacterium TAE3-ERU3]
MSKIALTFAILSLVAVLGLWLGNIKFRRVSIGVGGVLFGGIFVAHFLQEFNIELDHEILTFLQEFGLILFVYTIGIQVGPGFFSSLRQSGLKLNLFAASIVLISTLLVIGFHYFFDISLPEILGIYAGAVTNTPALGAGQQMLSELGVADSTATMGAAYAMAYPFGIFGIILSMWLIRAIFQISISQQAALFSRSNRRDNAKLTSMNMKVTNPNLHGHRVDELPIFDHHNVVCSRLRRGETFIVPKDNTVLELGDLLHVVGDPEDLRKAMLVVGEEVNVSLSTRGTEFRSVRVVVTNEKVLGKKIQELRITEKYDVVISRLNRTGVELVPGAQTTLQFGDVLNLVGKEDAINAVIAIIGNVQQKLQQVQMLPIFIGIGLGVLLGSLPLNVPGFPVALKLGLAGGPLIVALLLGRIGSIGSLYWFMPPSANLALRELGIVLFLAVVGLKSGGEFVHTLLHGDGLQWMVYAMFITLLPLMIVGIVAWRYAHMNYLTICGLLAGSATDPPALAFANAMHEESGAAVLSYVTVYPLVMFLRIMSPQIITLILWTSGG